jgi:hypothetical protein
VRCLIDRRKYIGNLGNLGNLDSEDNREIYEHGHLYDPEQERLIKLKENLQKSIL